MKYRVPVVRRVTEILIVEANSKEEAMFLAEDDDDSDYVTHEETIDGDPEVYYPDITVVQEEP